MESNPTHGSQDVLRARVLSLLEASGMCEELRPHAQDVAGAVAAACETEFPGEAVSTAYLGAVTARVLRQLGWGPSADSLESSAVRDPDLEILLGERDCSLAAHRTLWRLLSEGIVRPVRLHTAGPGRAWMLELDRLIREPADLLPLTLLPALRGLALALAPSWDCTSGHGALAIRDPRLGRAPAGRSRGKTRGGVEDACAYVGAVLRDVSEERAWREAPRVLCVRA